MRSENNANFFHKNKIDEKEKTGQQWNSREDREIGEALTTWHKEEEEEENS